ncbi:MAG: MerR family transcriptional regulator [Phreatobacter sp.]|uniref:MerR family transcriptional regulator n=1 Tax=Phreatobacter sp. TaxID=1966341 RepID=UPI0027330E25|nr:MerR family transcriptional regulator [Phreatobacter sp.]MDP2800909.1 MerR family transcriptional regulator [Phreatobacter sp.]
MTYDISTLAKRTGVSVSTIRAWETRYNLIRPARSSGGHRIYGTSDAERVALFKELTDLGHRPRDIAALATDKLARMRATEPAEPLMFAQLASALERAMRQRDRGSFQRHLVAAFGLLPPIDAAGLYSWCLQEIGTLWEDGTFSVADEHIFSFTARNVIIAATQTRPTLLDATPIGFATLEGEQHEHGLLTGAFLASCAGMQTVYFGTSVPISHLAKAAHQDAIRALLISVVHVEEIGDVSAKVQGLAQMLDNGTELWLACAACWSASFSAIMGVTVLHSYAELRAKLAMIR